ncbi:uncharacterized protein LOC141696022 [Apium graveolens]|uniref:uncharacterized protein LOC141696022 n=1 Tax=Apium graveolens TaxID=4045 RepID=UPI003D79BB48
MVESGGTSSGNAWTRNNPLVSQDMSSVFYIHPSDANTTQLVSVKFNGTGYSNWKRSIMLSLSAKNKLGFVDGTVIKPVASHVDFKLWERCNDLVCSWLLCNLDDSISRSVMFFKTAREIWLDLEERFGYASMTQIFSLEQHLTELEQGSKNVSDFFTEIKSIWDAMSDISPLPCCTCRKCTWNVTQKVLQMEQDRKLLQFMMKLSDRFATVRGDILMQQPMPIISNAFGIFSQEERHQSLSQVTQQTEALAFMADNKKGLKKSNGNYKGSQIAGGATGFKKNTYFCTHCNVAGHSVERCFKLHGYPPNFKFKDRKVAANVSVNSSGISNDNAVNSGISVAQYHQLMDLLNKQNTSGAGSSQISSFDH